MPTRKEENNKWWRLTLGDEHSWFRGVCRAAQVIFEQVSRGESYTRSFPLR